MSRDKWIIDGNYMYTLPMRLNRCDTVSSLTCRWTYVWQELKSAWAKDVRICLGLIMKCPRNHINDNIASPLGDSRTEHFYIMTKEDYHAIHIS